VWERQMGFPSRPSPCCSPAHAPVEVEMWRHRFESSRATAIKKKTGGCARSTRATPGVLLRQKPKNALAHFPKMHLALTHVQSTRPLPLASPTSHSLGQSSKIPIPCSRTPVQRSAVYVSPTSSPPLQKTKR